MNEPDPEAQGEDDAPGAPPPVIAGIGASAGGLNACRALLEHLPADSGIAIVLIQHLAPQHESMLSELLGRSASMPVVQASDGQRVEANCVYVIPPNRGMSIDHGVLHLLPRCDDPFGRMPVDHFLHALAEDQGGRAIGVILSGTASDGTLGLKAVKAAGGITFAQDEASAEYFGMPHSAIAAGCVDFVLPPERIAAELASIARHPYVLARQAPPAQEEFPEGGDQLKKILLLLRSRTGNDFTYYRQSTIKRRIKRRMLLHRVERLADYVKLLQRAPAEVDGLFKDILINVTELFREPDAFEALKQEVFPRLMEHRQHDLPLRIWVAGCATGEEAYSVAIVLLEFLGDEAAATSIQIFATDIDADAIDTARLGFYGEGIKSKVSAERLRRFFVKTPRGYEVVKSIRDLCVFAVQNVAKDPPFSRLDLVLCRNLLIYLEPVLQKKLLRLFHYALRPAGFLMLGNSETVGGASELFSLLSKRHKIYARKSVAPQIAWELPAAAAEPPEPVPQEAAGGAATRGSPARDIQRLAERTILTEYGPPGVIINAGMEILHFQGRTGAFLEPGHGAASLNLFKMARQELLFDLRAVVHQALRSNERSRRGGVPMQRDGEQCVIDLQVIPLGGEAGMERFFLVLFEDVTPAPPPEAAAADGAVARDGQDQRVQALERELAMTREYMQSVIEDQEATNEELTSANEEIQSSNEELQSTNEELETAKEELQSMNEELATVNEELENRNQALSQVNADLVNLLSSVELPIVILDRNLKIRHFTPPAGRLLNLIGSDVGRSIGDLRPNLELADLQQECEQVMRDLAVRSREVADNEGRWYSMRLRPYLSAGHRIEGLIATFVDIDEVKRVERLKQESRQARLLAALVRDSNDAIVLLDSGGRVLAWNKGAERLYGYTEEEALQLGLEDLVPERRRSEAHRLIREWIDGDNQGSVKTRRRTKDGTPIGVTVTASVLREDGESPTIALTERAAGSRRPPARAGP